MIDAEGYPIDVVIAWVDGSDPEWRAEKSKWLKLEDEAAWSAWTTGELRYRDWGILKYWFRSIERNIPWVNRIHFVTWGHLPAWLDVSNPKLNVVNHEEFIPHAYLPTFNSRVIDVNLHRIEGLAEHFIYFNDDMYVMSPMKRTMFFRKGLPCDFAALGPAKLEKKRALARAFNDMYINEHFSQRASIRKHPLKWINPKYGAKTVLKSLLVMGWPYFSMIEQDHLASNYLKSTFMEVWAAEGDELDRLCRHRFRAFDGVNQWLMRDWQRASGNFYPRKMWPKADCFFAPGKDNSPKEVKRVSDLIVHPKAPMACFNDDCCNTEEEFELWSTAIQDAFEQAYPTPSSFEKTIAVDEQA